MNETIQTLINRSSTKGFKNEHIKKEELDLIVKAGLKAPSGMNKQKAILLVVTNDEMVKKLSDLNASFGTFDSDPFYGAKDVIVCLAKKEDTYMYDGSLAMGNMLNAAYSLGVGSCWIHRCKEVFNTEEGKAILKDLGIDYEVEGIGFAVLGYPIERKPAKEILDNRVFYID